ncbi:AAA family ATPase [Chelativorans sp.]|uniref:AAA family ATPase n=1 Tax=Chelativorans sp. TaxID=2203393 RepID=UPI002811AC07|nr:AAA family ATPase [Chelativorans sp.]
MNRFVVISGCSGGGKSTLLTELQRRGYNVVEEPGRRIIAEQRESGGESLPWRNPEAFARRAIEVALSDRATARKTTGWVFFDRGLIDAAAALQHITREPTLARFLHQHRYNTKVFLTPPWPEIFSQDADRRHDFASAVEEYDRLCAAYPSLGYEVHVLAKRSVAERADIVLAALTST